MTLLRDRVFLCFMPHFDCPTFGNIYSQIAFPAKTSFSVFQNIILLLCLWCCSPWLLLPLGMTLFIRLSDRVGELITTRGFLTPCIRACCKLSGRKLLGIFHICVYYLSKVDRSMHSGFHFPVNSRCNFWPLEKVWRLGSGIRLRLAHSTWISPPSKSRCFFSPAGRMN